LLAVGLKPRIFIGVTGGIRGFVGGGSEELIVSFLLCLNQWIHDIQGSIIE
ncbi:Hypothetical protein FKW44_002010, partial [Caligus rogercresseyi]